MLRTLFSLTALVAAPAAHADEVLDALLLPGGEQLWIALDGAPQGAVAERGSGVLTLRLSGFQPDAPREIAPAMAAPVSGIFIQPTALGANLVIEGRFDQSRVELREGGILIDFSAMAADWELSSAEADDPRADDGHQDAEGSGHAAHSASTDPQHTAPAASDMSAAVAAEAASLASETASGAAATPTALAPADPAAEDAPASTDQSAARSQPEDFDTPGPCDATAAAVASSPWDLDSLTRHADCLVEIGESINGAGLYERVLAFEPGHFQAALGLARIRERQGRRSEAARLFETAADSALTDGQALAARQAARRLSEDS